MTVQESRQRRRSAGPVPRPFLKWAGGKGQLLGELLPRVERAAPFPAYHEPFIGGGALFFELSRTGRLDGVEVFLSDNNSTLIATYLGVRDDPDRLLALLAQHEERHSKDYYYAVRGQAPEDPIERAARMIYLNRTCFNGLYRENSRGGFNVPFGDYKNPLIRDPENLGAASRALGPARIDQRGFETVLDVAQPGDFVYFDPPYDPVSKTASFTAYDKGGFGADRQRRLAEVFAELTRRGVRALLSNSMTDFVRELYRDFTIETVYAARSVNSRGDRRGAVQEALVRNY